MTFINGPIEGEDYKSIENFKCGVAQRIILKRRLKSLGGISRMIRWEDEDSFLWGETWSEWNDPWRKSFILANISRDPNPMSLFDHMGWVRNEIEKVKRDNLDPMTHKLRMLNIHRKWNSKTNTSRPVRLSLISLNGTGFSNAYETAHAASEDLFDLAFCGMFQNMFQKGFFRHDFKDDK